VSESQVHFGGPRVAPGRLRDLLAERVAAVPAGGAIDWVTYYFRDRRLADALVAARQRGVAVRVTLEGRPRTRGANRAVAERLAAGLGPGLRLVTSPMDRWPQAKFWRARVHEKLYCFSHPRPAALLGSFNPSGDEPELEPDVVREIGDQDRGYNFLVETNEAPLVAGLVAHARRLHRGHHGVLSRLAPAANRVLRGAELEIRFTPGLHGAPAPARLRRLGRGAHVRLAASHLSGEQALRCLEALARRGARVAILAETTPRRVPAKSEARLRAAGIELRFVAGPGPVPMHDKFLLIEEGAQRGLLFGSSNWTRPSLRLNREIHASSASPHLFEAFAARWQELAADAVEARPGP